MCWRGSESVLVLKEVRSEALSVATVWNAGVGEAGETPDTELEERWGRGEREEGGGGGGVVVVVSWGSSGNHPLG